MYRVERQHLQEQLTAVVRGKASAPELGGFVAHAYGTVAAHLERLAIAMAGRPFARFRHLGLGEYEVEAGFPVQVAIAPEGEVEASSLPGGPVAMTWHAGPYDDMGRAYEALADWVEQHHGVIVGEAWEVYSCDPEEQPDPATWRTQVVQPFG